MQEDEDREAEQEEEEEGGDGKEEVGDVDHGATANDKKPEAKPKAKAKAEGKAKATSKAKTSTEPVTPKGKGATPGGSSSTSKLKLQKTIAKTLKTEFIVTHEGSRKQYLCRTIATKSKPSRSKCFGYGDSIVKTKMVAP